MQISDTRKGQFSLSFLDRYEDKCMRDASEVHQWLQTDSILFSCSCHIGINRIS